MDLGKNISEKTIQKRLVAGNPAASAFVVPVIATIAGILAVFSLSFGTYTAVSACDYYCGGYTNDYYAPTYGGYSDYNYVQYPTLYYQYNQNPAPRNPMTDFYNNASSLQYPYLTYRYNQNPAPRDPMADYYANSASTRYPYLQYQYASNPAPRDPMADYYANAASASYPYSIYVPAGSNQASVLSKYNVGSQYTSGQNYGYQNYSGYNGGQQGGGFIMTSGY